ncbi:MAG: YgaP family membrane protein [Anaerolineae bacterium]
MTKNVSNLDRIIRLVVAVVIGVLILVNVLHGALAIILGIVGLVLLVTALVGICPLYALLKISTKK